MFAVNKMLMEYCVFYKYSLISIFYQKKYWDIEQRKWKADLT